MDCSGVPTGDGVDIGGEIDWTKAKAWYRPLPPPPRVGVERLQGCRTEGLRPGCRHGLLEATPRGAQ